MSSITNYFSQTKKTSIEPQKDNGIKASEKFYKNCLAECKNVECEKEKEKLKKQISELKEKIEKIEDAMESCRSVLMEKDTVIAKLQVDSTQSSAMDKPQMQFEPFTDILNGDQINHLKTISTNERGDSTFVCSVLKYLYGHNLDSVKNKTACGKNSKGQARNMMIPEKKGMVRDMYNERLSSLAVGIEEKKTREKKLNKLINDAFNNIAKSSELQALQNQLE